MDPTTLAAYDHRSAHYATQWHEQPPPCDLHDLLRTHFSPGPTIDVGCGSGRDVAWLHAQGFTPVLGIDGSEGLLAQARARHPTLAFRQALLPQLDGLEGSSFQNVLCETVLMHLPLESVAPATAALIDLLRPGGTLVLTWRVSGHSLRDDHGRLYTAFDAALVREAAAPAGDILLDDEVVSASSGRRIHRLVLRRG
ncbi:class I SAM-dependent methyltransferase [Ramlibacter sp. AW1]|uniref:Class I SAM-dependent methyltransferase n=1 Tax=Ramlibacter aurantiacus TaxID=2801330 RepID=A0A936ZIU3_9BURK|nr:class I SAM-dependent methyltransferase [Ramlibacter aurantiacus]MBL0420632.1 class I SAM-dependent methyltransferase [Ramlibacter aurantiacus]